MSQPLLICASTQYWAETWFRKQHFAAALSRRRPVLYAEPSRSIARRLPHGLDPRLTNPLLAARQRLEGQVRVWTPPRGLPFWTHGPVSRLQYARYGQMLRQHALAAGFDRTWLWLYNPLYIQASATLRPERIVFDLVDDLPAYEANAHSRANMLRCVEQSLRSADLVIATSRKLAETYASRTRAARIPVIPNGVRGEWIDLGESGEVGPVPEELRELPRPIIGFAGALFVYLDYEMLLAAARAVPEGTLVCVGPVHDEAAAGRLRAEPNVTVLGPRLQADLPRYLAAFDVALAPFLAGPVRRAVNPLKVYEYLALGCPVVASTLESLTDEPIAEEIRFADSPTAFARAVREELAAEARARSAGDAAALRRRRAASVRPYAWDVLAEQLEAEFDRLEARA